MGLRVGACRDIEREEAQNHHPVATKLFNLETLCLHEEQNGRSGALTKLMVGTAVGMRVGDTVGAALRVGADVGPFEGREVGERLGTC